MALSARNRAAAEDVATLALTNPFLPDRIALERRVLGAQFAEHGAVWSHHADGVDDSPNFRSLMERTGSLANKMQQALLQQAETSDGELRLYEDLVSFLLYYEFRDDLTQLMRLQGTPHRSHVKDFWKRYRVRFSDYFEITGYRFSPHVLPHHLFALGFQLRRAFENTFYFIIGKSLAAADLRASVWQSIFTHDMGRYSRVFYRKLGDYVTLVLGPSGTGKELVARAIGLSRYIPFDEQKLDFAQDFRNSFHPINLSALSPTLIESELFGHSKGAFTGATADRSGWLDSCGEYGSVFLDEIGDLDTQIQVKLLRVFEERAFHRLGETKDRPFRGKVIAATHRDLAEEIRNGRFRQDFYYRICSDVISTRPLRERIREQPEELHDLVRFIVQREAIDDSDDLTHEVLKWIEQNLGHQYAWPGNIRELEQCVRNVLIRQQYHPMILDAADPSGDPLMLLRQATAGVALTAEELLRRYCTLAFKKYGSYEAAAEHLGMDRRTLRKRVDPRLLDELHAGNANEK